MHLPNYVVVLLAIALCIASVALVGAALILGIKALGPIG